MRLLLDTHTFLWFVLGDSQLSQTAKSLIVDPTNEKWISPVCYWEVAIKVSVGKYVLAVPHEVFFRDFSLDATATCAVRSPSLA